MNGTGLKHSVLVVDDDRSICKLMHSILDMEGYPHKIVTSGEQDRLTIQAEAFDVLISDIYLGDASNLELLDLMKQQHPDAKVVIMTAHRSVKTAVKAVHRGAFDYISKPFAVDDMLEILRRIEEKRSLTQTASVGPKLAETLPQKTEIIGT